MEIYSSNVSQNSTSIDVFFQFNATEKSEMLDFLNSINKSNYVNSNLEQDQLQSFLQTTYNMYFSIASSKSFLIKTNVSLNYLILLRMYAKKYPRSITESLCQNIKVFLNSLYGEVSLLPQGFLKSYNF